MKLLQSIGSQPFDTSMILRLFFFIPLPEIFFKMELLNQTDLHTQAETISDTHNKIVLDASQVSNAVLKRLIEEVKNDQANGMFAYDRTHNRHNR